MRTDVQLILASGSPRRRELLDQLGVRFRVVPSGIDESRLPGESPGRYVERMARNKAEAVLQREAAALPVLGADTVVVLDGDILDKPLDQDAAAETLRRLSGRTHTVMSAVALLATGAPQRCVVNESRVTFGPLDEAWIRAYCASGEPLDKAGAYGVQGQAASRIRHLAGSFHGVMGLPLFETAELLRSGGVDLFPLADGN